MKTELIIYSALSLLVFYFGFLMAFKTRKLNNRMNRVARRFGLKEGQESPSFIMRTKISGIGFMIVALIAMFILIQKWKILT